jgi:hypothetical protein
VGWARTAVAWSLWAAAQYHFKWPTAGPSAVLSSALSSELKPWGTPSTQLLRAACSRTEVASISHCPSYKVTFLTWPRFPGSTC